jgi:isopentenyl diphosphate isomerase/L-lactate dehydrogenase-like FMN-dependent dehydrogenase/rubredoxin
MTSYLCNVCNIYVYDEQKGDPETGLEPGTKVNDIPESWRCPICNATKDSLKTIEEGKVESTQETMNSKDTGNITLVDVRKKALERMAGICAVNKVCDGQPDRLCQGQKYGGPIGLGGTGKGLSFQANVDALDKIKLKTRLITRHAEPNMDTTIYGQKIAFPVMPSSLSGVKASMGGSIPEEGFAYAVLQGASDAGTLGWIGNTADEGKELAGVQAVKKVGVGIPIFKPQKNERLLELIKMAEDAEAAAVGVDVDGCGSTNWERLGKPVYRKSESDLKELADSTELSFIAKGIMSVEDAQLAVRAGCAGIDVSNHGGRVLGSTRGVAEVLPEIVNAVRGKVTITAGGGVRTGFDVLKMLAMGADSVLIGRDIARAAIGGGAEGVKLHFEYIKSDLRRGMIMTSCNAVADIDEKIIEIERRGIQ